MNGDRILLASIFVMAAAAGAIAWQDYKDCTDNDLRTPCDIFDGNKSRAPEKKNNDDILILPTPGGGVIFF